MIKLLFSTLLIQMTLFTSLAEARNLPDTFPLIQGFLGGDGAFSVPLSAKKSLWIFGDTFWGSDQKRSLGEGAFLSNSFAVTEEQESGELSFEYFRGTAKNPEGVFSIPEKLSQELLEGSSDGHLRIWPKAGIRVASSLWLAVVLVRTKTDNGMGFEELGVDFVQVLNPEAPLAQWQYKWHKYSRSNQYFPATALVREDGYIYSFVTIKENESTQSMGIARAPVKSFPKGMRYLNQDGKWSSRANEKKLKRIMSTGSTEMSVSFKKSSDRKNGGAWVAVYSDNAFTMPVIQARQASSLIGPWSEPVELFSYPEYNPELENFVPEVFCYAGKEHPQFGSSTDWVITYACNTQSFEALMGRMDVYVPKVIRVKNPFWQ